MEIMEYVTVSYDMVWYDMNWQCGVWHIFLFSCFYVLIAGFPNVIVEELSNKAASYESLKKFNEWNSNADRKVLKANCLTVLGESPFFHNAVN